MNKPLQHHGGSFMVCWNIGTNQFVRRDANYTT